MRDVRVLDDDGRLVGYVDADKTSEDPPRWWSDVKLAPDADVGVVLPQMLAWLDDRAQSGLLRVWTGVEDSRVLDAFAKSGFEESRHSYRMEISLEDEPSEPKWPDGIAVRAFQPCSLEAASICSFRGTSRCCWAHRASSGVTPPKSMVQGAPPAPVVGSK